MKGFGLIEILLSIALITLIFGLGSSIFITISNKNDLDVAVNYFENSLIQAQTRAIAIEEDDRWGVYLDQGLITVFKGTDYSNRDRGFDNIFEISERVEFSDDNEYVFSKREGLLDSGLSTTFTFENDVRGIDVNIYGIINE